MLVIYTIILLNSNTSKNADRIQHCIYSRRSRQALRPDAGGSSRIHTCLSQLKHVYLALTSDFSLKEISILISVMTKYTEQVFVQLFGDSAKSLSPLILVPLKRVSQPAGAKCEAVPVTAECYNPHDCGKSSSLIFTHCSHT